jgi:uncharacterized protein DUF4259
LNRRGLLFSRRFWQGFYSLPTPATHYLDGDEASEAVAAAEVVSVVVGCPGDDVPEDLAQWLAGHNARVDRALVDLALGALGRIRVDSELRDLWAHDSRWLDEVAGLEARLRRALAGMV